MSDLLALWPDRAVQALVRICTSELSCDPSDLLNVMVSESGANPAAHNLGSDASGLIQFMPQTLRNLGWKDDTATFRTLSVEAQMPFVERYFDDHRGKLGSGTALYLATFLPAFLNHADEPSFVLAAEGDPHTGGWYASNFLFDAAHKGTIVVADLTVRLQIVRSLPPWKVLSPIVQRENDPPLATTDQIAAALERLGYEVEAGGFVDTVRHFQADRMGPGEVDGLVGPKTRLALRTALQSGA